MYTYRYREYGILKQSPPILQKLDPRTYIGHLTSYNSRNFYGSQITAKNKETCIRDANWVDRTKYNSDGFDIGITVLDSVETNVQTFEINLTDTGVEDLCESNDMVSENTLFMEGDE